MGVYVKGMKMPKNCDDCFFIGRGYPDWCSLPQIPNGEDEIDDTKKRPDWCPLVEIPEPHGDLIDRDAVVKEMINGIRAGNCEEGYEMYPNINNLDDCAECVRYADAVIEAEGE